MLSKNLNRQGVGGGVVTREGSSITNTGTVVQRFQY
jgi:hypothetical protein